MKVIVQDLETGTYLAPGGQWVAAKADAKDFLTLLRAYHYAKDNTSRRFQVLLHCTEDQYSAPIITGVGTAAAAKETKVAAMEAPTHATLLSPESATRSRNLGPYAHRFNWTRNDLN